MYRITDLTGPNCAGIAALLRRWGGLQLPSCHPGYLLRPSPEAQDHPAKIPATGKLRVTFRIAIPVQPLLFRYPAWLPACLLVCPSARLSFNLKKNLLLE